MSATLDLFYCSVENSAIIIHHSLQVPGLLDSVASFQQCDSGLKHALLLVVPTFYLLSCLLFVVLGAVMTCWDRHLEQRGELYSALAPEEDANH